MQMHLPARQDPRCNRPTQINPFEKKKNEKAGHLMWEEVTDLAKLVREGKTSWEDLDLDDVDMRLKWCGMFHRRKRTPGKFMMRLRIPNGIVTSSQVRGCPLRGGAHLVALPAVLPLCTSRRPVCLGSADALPCRDGGARGRLRGRDDPRQPPAPRHGHRGVRGGLHGALRHRPHLGSVRHGQRAQHDGQPHRGHRPA